IGKKKEQSGGSQKPAPALALSRSRTQARSAGMVETGSNALCLPMLGSRKSRDQWKDRLNSLHRMDAANSYKMAAGFPSNKSFRSCIRLKFSSAESEKWSILLRPAGADMELWRITGRDSGRR